MKGIRAKNKKIRSVLVTLVLFPGYDPDNKLNASEKALFSFFDNEKRCSLIKKKCLCKKMFSDSQNPVQINIFGQRFFFQYHEQPQLLYNVSIFYEFKRD